MKTFKTCIFWLLSLTWGSIMTTVGLFAAAGMLVTGHKSTRFGHAIYFETKKAGWGGVNFGPIFIVSCGSSLHTKSHEYGHGFQNIIFGPGHVIISICSFVRYWWREWQIKKGVQLKPYDSVWFEGQATKWGTKAYENYTKTN